MLNIFRYNCFIIYLLLLQITIHYMVYQLLLPIHLSYLNQKVQYSNDILFTICYRTYYLLT